MPAKRRAANASEPTAPPKARQSKLAKEHDISAAEENEIKEAFKLFALPRDGEKEGVIPTKDVRRAMIALNIPPRDQAELGDFLSILDGDDEGVAGYEPFVAVCALKLRARVDASDDGARAAEVREAFRLFTNGADEGPITVAHLRRVAKVLREDEAAATDELLRDMVLEANGGAGVARGVSLEEFEGVMRRAGVWR